MSNAGQIALGVVGGVLGFFLGGGPVGAAYGLQLGLAIGTVVSPTQLPGTFGPRLQDKRTTTATLGAPITEVFGTDVVAGTVIWLGDVVEIATTEEVGGKGGPEGENTTYSYTQSIAIGLCRGPKGGILRIWENGKLLYDARERQPDEETDAYTERVTASLEYLETFTLYPGNETQLPDPTIELKEGVGNVPAYRGLMYVVYHDRQLKDEQGLRHPSFKFEIAGEEIPVPYYVIVITRPDADEDIPHYSLVYIDDDFTIEPTVTQVADMCQDSGVAGFGTDVAGFGRAFVATSQTSTPIDCFNMAATSTDAGESWLDDDLSPAFGDPFPYMAPAAVACSGGLAAPRFVVVGYNDLAEARVKFSGDDFTWIAGSLAFASMQTDELPNAVDWIDGVFYCGMRGLGGGPAGGIISSTNGESWTRRATGNNTTMPDIISFVFGDGLYVAVGADAIRTSSDGITWSGALTPTNYGTTTRRIGYGFGVWVKLSDAGISITNNPTGTWSAPVMPPIIDEVCDIMFDGRRFVVVGGLDGESCIIASPLAAVGSWTLLRAGDAARPAVRIVGLFQ